MELNVPKSEPVSEDQESKEEIENYSVKTYKNAFKKIQQLQDFSLKVNNPKLLYVKCEAENSIYAEMI